MWDVRVETEGPSNPLMREGRGRPVERVLNPCHEPLEGVQKKWSISRHSRKSDKSKLHPRFEKLRRKDPGQKVHLLPITLLRRRKPG